MALFCLAKCCRQFRAAWKITYLVVRGKTCWYSTDAVTAPCGGVSSLETLGGFHWQFFLFFFFVVVVFINVELFLKDELLCRYFHGIAMNRRDPHVFLQCGKYLLNE